MNLKSINFVCQTSGKGIVQFDSSDQKYLIKSAGANIGSLQHNNFKIAKHHYYDITNDAGEVKRKQKLSLSADGIRHYIFSQAFPFQSTLIEYNDELLYHCIGSQEALLRGYMFAKLSDGTLKKSSCIMLTDAEQISSGVSVFEVGSSSGTKCNTTVDAPLGTDLYYKEAIEKATVDDPAGTGLYYKETIGDVTYEFEGGIDFKELQFISLSDLFGRRAMNPDKLKIANKYLEKRLGSPLQEPGYHLLKDSVMLIPEYGILLTPDQMVTLTKTFFFHLLRFNIIKSRAYTRISSLKIRYIEDPLEDFEKPLQNVLEKGKINMDPLTIKPSDINIFYKRLSDKEAKEHMGEVVEATRVKKDRDSAGREENKAIREEKEARRVNTRKDKK
jgi:hypothetical protein